MTKANYYIRKHFKSYLVIGLGSLLMAIAVNCFLLPFHMLSGGTSGIAMILFYMFQWPVGLLVALMNVPIFYAAYRLLDKHSVITGIYGMLVFAVSVDLTSFLLQYQVADDIFLAAVYGGVLTGVGAGLVFRANGNTGGADIIAVILKKYYSLDIGVGMFAINLLLMLISAFLFGFKPAMYTLVSMYITAQVIDRVIEGFNRKKTVTIISDHGELIADAIMNEVGRGVTFLQGEGAFTSRERKVILAVVSLTQVAKIKRVLESIDPRAFMIVQDAAEVSGRGFTLPSPKSRPRPAVMEKNDGTFADRE